MGWAIVIMYILVAILAPFLAPYGETEVFSGQTLSPPSAQHWFGTDANGMDVFSRTLYAARLDLPIAAGAVALSATAGITLGLLTGYIRGAFDMVVLRTMDVLQAFPLLILGIAFVAATGQSLLSVVVIIAFLDMPIYLRLIRSETLQLRESTFTEAGRALGNPTWRLLWKHILPNALPPVVVQTSLRLAWAIKITASLAFVGVGISVPTAEWGSMIRVGAQSITSGGWWASVFPGLAVLILSLGLNLMADAMQERMGHRSK